MGTNGLLDRTKLVATNTAMAVEKFMTIFHHNVTIKFKRKFHKLTVWLKTSVRLVATTSSTFA